LYTAEEYCLNCFRYIHANPVAARLVKDPGDWKWSSYNFYAGNSVDNLCNKELARRYCGYNEGDFINKSNIEAKWADIIELGLFS
jgi:putative transposase